MQRECSIYRRGEVELQLRFARGYVSIAHGRKGMDDVHTTRVIPAPSRLKRRRLDFRVIACCDVSHPRGRVPVIKHNETQAVFCFHPNHTRNSPSQIQPLKRTRIVDGSLSACPSTGRDAALVVIPLVEAQLCQSS